MGRPAWASDRLAQVPPEQDDELLKRRHKRIIGRLHSLALGLVGAALLGFGAGGATSAPTPGTTERLTVDSAGAQANGTDNGAWQLSADGCDALLVSNASNLVADDTNGAYDDFVRDCNSGVVERVSIAPDESEFSSDSIVAAISADGNLVAFESGGGVFLRDRTLDQTTAVPGPSSCCKQTPAISGDGNYVAYIGGSTLYLADLQAGTYASVTSGVASGTNFMYGPSPISFDGRFLVFSTPGQLTADDHNSLADAYVYDRVANSFERVSIGPQGEDLTYSAYQVSTSPNGRYVVYSGAFFIGSNGYPGLGGWIRDRQAGTTQRVDVTSSGGVPNSNANGLSAADTCEVAYESGATDIVPGDSNDGSDVFVWNCQTNSTELASVDSAGVQGNQENYAPFLTGDGGHVSFVADSTNLVPGDTNGALDGFVHHRSSAVAGIHVSGNQIVDASGAPLVLHGVNRSGTEYMCINGYGIFDGPNDAASIQAIKAWGANAVRVPLNEDCWLDINGVDPAYAGANYRQAIVDYVATLETQGMVPILDLQWTAPGTEPARDPIKPMPDRDHSIDFWREVAITFRDDGQVVFDLFNEPYPDGNQDTTEAWVCWRDGSPCPGVSYDAVGMQELVDTVRATGARNLLLLGGVRFANAIARWPEFAPSDPAGNIAPSWHIYPYNLCHTPACYDADVGPLLSQLPVVAGEIGSTGTYPACDRDFPDTTMLWLDAHGVGYLAWAWDAWGQCDALILDYAGTPTEPYGRTYRDHLLGIPQRPSGMIAAAGDGTAAVSWIPSLDHGSAAVSSFTVTASPGGATATVPGGQTSATVAGLANGTSYTFTVTATNIAGTSSPSASSAAVTPQAGNPPPAAATGTVSPTSSTTVSTSSDPAATGGTSATVTVPSGTAGGTVTMTQTATSEPSPSGYLFGGVQVDVSAPAGTAANPLALVFATAPPIGAPLDATTLGSTQIYRAEGGGAPTLVPGCAGPAGQAQPDPCVSGRQYVTIGGGTYVQLTVLSSTASHWNSARPRPGAVSVADGGYSPATLTVQPGAPVAWTFGGRKAHSVTDATGLGAAGAPWFNSGAKTSGSFTFTFPAAGSFAYRSTVKGDSIAGSVLVPVVVTPGSGTSSTTFSVLWSTNTIAGYVFDVQYRFRAAGSKQWKAWIAWRSGVADSSGAFASTQGAGTYAFRARLRNTATGRASAYSPDVTIALT